MHGPHGSVGRQRLPFESSFGLFESQQAIFLLYFFLFFFFDFNSMHVLKMFWRLANFEREAAYAV